MKTEPQVEPPPAGIGWQAPFILGIIAPLGATVMGIVANTINGQVSSDYFALVQGWDGGSVAAKRAIALGALVGWQLGMVFGFFFFITSMASTRFRCPLKLMMQMLALAMAVVAGSWLIGGAIGLTVAVVWPGLWGRYLVGVPSRVSLPRYGWVAGSSTGAYLGTLIAVLVCSIVLHLRWRRLNHRIAAFPVVMHSAESRVQ